MSRSPEAIYINEKMRLIFKSMFDFILLGEKPYNFSIEKKSVSFYIPLPPKSSSKSHEYLKVAHEYFELLLKETLLMGFAKNSSREDAVELSHGRDGAPHIYVRVARQRYVALCTSDLLDLIKAGGVAVSTEVYRDFGKSFVTPTCKKSMRGKAQRSSRQAVSAPGHWQQNMRQHEGFYGTQPPGGYFVAAAGHSYSGGGCTYYSALPQQHGSVDGSFPPQLLQPLYAGDQQYGPAGGCTYYPAPPADGCTYYPALPPQYGWGYPYYMGQQASLDGFNLQAMQEALLPVPGDMAQAPASQSGSLSTHYGPGSPAIFSAIPTTAAGPSAGYDRTLPASQPHFVVRG